MQGRLIPPQPVAPFAIVTVSCAKCQHCGLRFTRVAHSQSFASVTIPSFTHEMVPKMSFIKPAYSKLPLDWRRVLDREFGLPYLHTLDQFLTAEAADGAVYPARDLLFNALQCTPLAKVRVVILGQDPYHGLGQAQGLCFSVPVDQPVPPSLKNIYRELAADLLLPVAKHGDLSGWAAQGVLLLNTVLTVNAGVPGSHRGRGWERFTDQIIARVNDKQSPVVFMLWGAQALQKAALIDGGRHLVLTAAHPSPLSAYRGFFGCGHFSRANQFLVRQGLPEIDWRVAV